MTTPEMKRTIQWLKYALVVSFVIHVLTSYFIVDHKIDDSKEKMAITYAIHQINQTYREQRALQVELLDAYMALDRLTKVHTIHANKTKEASETLIDIMNGRFEGWKD